MNEYSYVYSIRFRKKLQGHVEQFIKRENFSQKIKKSQNKSFDYYLSPFVLAYIDAMF